ncbi:MAG: hypothetical protein K6A44_05655 [bacterium]|nr:hypothetical protein [bacterium]
MGIAASQARYLYLTARQTNVEFEGQQINQARTNLANEQSGLFREMLKIEAPVVPTLYGIKQNCAKWEKNDPPGPNPDDYKGGKDSSEYKYDLTIWTAYVENGYDANAAYDAAMDQYNAQQLEYENAMDKINVKTQEIHEKDQVLELQLRQLDTEQETIVTELESVKKVIDKNIENVFKTFQS